MIADEVVRVLASELREYLFTVNGETLPSRLVDALKLRRMKISTAESFTGGGVGGANPQTYEAEFTADSTDEDPIVRIRGTASSGEFDFTCHIRDIDPHNASYAELAALNRWLCRTGAYQTKFPGQAGSVLPCGMDCGDVSKKRDFISGIQNFIASASNSSHYPKYGPSIYAYARELLGIYQEFS